MSRAVRRGSIPWFLGLGSDFFSRDAKTFPYLANSGVFALMKTLIAFLLLCCFSALVALSAEPQPGVAIAIVYDTSGSMSDPAVGADGKQRPKYQVASEAMRNIVSKIDDFSKTNTVEATLITFRGPQVKIGPWNKGAFDKWLGEFRSPGGGTPLGEAILAADKSLAASKLAKKHIVVLTDGVSTGDITPDAALRTIKKSPNAPRVYVVAFDVKSQVFDAVKREGSLVLPATGASLDSGLTTLFGEKILLENEE